VELGGPSRSWPSITRPSSTTVLDVGTEGGALRLIVAGPGNVAIAAPAHRAVLPPGGVGSGMVLDLAATPTIRDRHGYRCLELDVLDSRPTRAFAPAHLPATHVMV
jgi:hypothetical protein